MRDNQQKYFPVRSVVLTLLAAGIMVLSVSEFRGAEKNAVYYNKKGWEFLDKEDNVRAIVSFKNALKLNKRYKEALLGLGKAYLRTGAPDESMRLFDEVLKLESGNTEARLGTGFALTAVGRYQEAINTFTGMLNVTEDNLEAHFGLARVYYLMDRRIWARRKLERILRGNPYHYDALLLMAELKSDDGRLGDAKKLIDKAIGSNPELPSGYVESGIILYKHFLRTGNRDYLAESGEEFQRALAVHPDNLRANRYLGHIAVIMGNAGNAVGYLEKALSVSPDNAQLFYSLGMAYEKTSNIDKALEYFNRAGDRSPSDDLTAAKIEDLLVLNGFKVGHPGRVNYGRAHIASAGKSLKENLVDEGILHLRRSLYLNPMLKEAQEMLRDLYYTLGYYRFYVDELKGLATMHPDGGYQDRLNIAVIKRRARLYARVGYAVEPPVRDIPGILILTLWTGGELTPHPDIGELAANYIGFALGQYGRQVPFSLKKRLAVGRKLETGEDSLGDNLEKISDMVRDGEIERPDYLLYGSVREGNGHLAASLRFMDFKTGVIIREYSLSENGKNALFRLSLRAAKQIYDSVPFRGRVLKIEDDRAVANLGTFDGLKPGDYLVVYQGADAGIGSRPGKKRKILLTVEEADTLLCTVKVRAEADLRLLEINDTVYPQEKRRARLIK